MTTHTPNYYSRLFWAHVLHQYESPGLSLHDLRSAFEWMTGRGAIRGTHFLRVILGDCASTAHAARLDTLEIDN